MTALQDSERWSSQAASRRRSVPRGDGLGRITPHRCHVNITPARRAVPWRLAGPACPPVGRKY
jgi:hypothetical protein